jgi:hypothetical protein
VNLSVPKVQDLDWESRNGGRGDMARHRLVLTFCLGVAVGLLLAIPLFAQGLLSWQQKDVTPMIAVRANMGEFIPVNGTAMGPTWKKEQVVPMVAVKPSAGEFVTRESAAIGISWQKSEVKPVIFVKYYMGGFVPSDER